MQENCRSEKHVSSSTQHEAPSIRRHDSKCALLVIRTAHNKLYLAIACVRHSQSRGSFFGVFCPSQPVGRVPASEHEETIITWCASGVGLLYNIRRNDFKKRITDVRRVRCRNLLWRLAAFYNYVIEKWRRYHPRCSTIFFSIYGRTTRKISGCPPKW